jgi:hypothetical protein
MKQATRRHPQYSARLHGLLSWTILGSVLMGAVGALVFFGWFVAVVYAAGAIIEGLL